MKIVTYPSEVLSRKAEEVTEFDENLAEIAREMFQTMYDSSGVGLAAPQVGISKRLCTLNCPDGDLGEVVMANPEIVQRSGRQNGEEGCLSFPGIFIKVQRAEKVTVSYRDLNGQEQTLEAEGLLARAIQHELDHLDGVLLVDKMTTIQRMANRRALTMLERREADGPETLAAEASLDQRQEATESE